MSSSPVYGKARSLVFCVVFCRSLFVLSSFFFWPLCCLSFFDLQIPIIWIHILCNKVQDLGQNVLYNIVYHSLIPYVIVNIYLHECIILLSFPHSRYITGFVTRLTRRVALVEQELLTLPEHMSPTPGF